MTTTRFLAFLAVLATFAVGFCSGAMASVEWKVRLEGTIIRADEHMIRLRTSQNEVVEVVRHSVPPGFDLRPGKIIRWIAPEFKQRKPSGNTGPKYPN